MMYPLLSVNDIIKSLLRENAALVAENKQMREALEEVDRFFNWGGFDIDFSNGVTHNGIDEGDVLGNNAMCSMTAQITDALSEQDEHK